MTVYLIHLERPLRDDHAARHYLGYCRDRGLRARLERHRAGHGARFLAAANEAGIGWILVRTWPGAGRDVERALKRRKEGPRLCPICNPGAREGLRILAWERRRIRRPRMSFASPGAVGIR